MVQAKKIGVLCCSIGAIMLLTLAGAPETSWGCTLPANAKFETDPADTSAPVPQKVELSLSGVRRGSAEMNSCADLGSLTFRVSPDVLGVGYVFKVVEGKAPEGISFGERPLSLYDSSLSFHWIDGKTRVQEEVDFWVTVTPVNTGGKPGPESERVHVYDGGTPEGCGGCAQGGGGAPPTWLLGVFGAVALWRRRSAKTRP